MTTYPELEYKTLYPILVFLLECRKNPTIIDTAPYSEPIKTAIREAVFTTTESTSDKKLTEIDLEAETIRLYESMKSIEMTGKLDEKEKIQLLKLQTSSLQDLLDMVKESKEIKKIREFQDYVFGILTDEQKERIVKDVLK